MRSCGIFLVLLTFVVGSSFGQYEPNFLGSLPTGDPEGVIVNEGLFSVRIIENREVTPENNFIALIRYTGGEVPTVDVDGDGLKPDLSVVESEGQFYLQLNNELDFENGRQWIISLDPGLPSPGLITVFVTDANDLPPMFTTYPEEALTVTEGPADGVVLFTCKATDPDSIDTNLRYSLLDLQNGDETPFRIDAGTGELRLGEDEVLDYQLQNTYRLQIKVSDSNDIHVVNAPMVTVVDVIDLPNLPPRWVAVSYRLEISENNELDLLLFTFRAIDDDLGVASPIEYTLVSVPQNNEGVDYLKIDPQTGALTANIIFDAEILSSELFEIKVMAKEVKDPKLDITETVVIFVRDLNDNHPTFPNGDTEQSFTVDVDENSFGILPGLDGLEIFDNDQGLEFSQFTASIEADDEAMEVWLNQVFTLNPPSGYGGATFRIQINADIDYEAPEWFDPIIFRVKVEETSDPATFAQGVITLNVQDENDHFPEFQDLAADGAIEFSVPEDVAINTVIGRIIATDQDRSDPFGTLSIRYSWSNPIPTKLGLNPLTGEISTLIANAFNRENLPEEVYVVEAMDFEGNPGSRKTTAVLRLDIDDINDEAPEIRSATRQVRIPENVTPDSNPIFDKIVVSDPDENPALSIECEVLGPDGADTSGWFTCEPTPGELGSINVRILLGEGIDYEVTNRVDVQLTVTDGNTAEGYVASNVEYFTVNILDVNDEPPIFDFDPTNPISTLECAEEGCIDPNEMEIYTFRATDLDTRPENFRFTITSDNADMLAFVELGPIDGILKKRDGAKIDYETMKTLIYHVTVMNCESDDKCDPTLSDTLRDVVINVVDINDNPPVFQSLETRFNVPEGNSELTVYEFIATDADDGRFGTVNYYLDEEYLGGIGLDEFEIDPVTGILRLKKELDREVIDEYQLRVVARDNVGSSSNVNEDEIYIIITVDDINDNQPEYSEPAFPDIFENETPVGTELGRVTVTDRDQPGHDNSKLTVTLIDVTFTKCPRCVEDGNWDWSEYFQGNFDSSPIFIITAKKSLLDYYGDFKLIISAVDAGENAEVVEANYPLTIVDTNNQSPVILYPPINMAIYISDILADGELVSEYHDLIGTLPPLFATDADDDSLPNGRVIFSVNPNGPGGENFQVIKENGQQFLAVKGSLTSHHEPLQVEIIATDGDGDGPNSARVIMRILVVPHENQPPEFQTRETTVQFIENDHTLMRVLPMANDLDTAYGDNIHDEVICYFIMDGDTTNSFQLNNEKRILTLSLTKALDREEYASYVLVIAAINRRREDCHLPPTISPGEESILRITVEVLDVKDTAPTFFPNAGPFSGGIKTTGEAGIGSSTSIVLRATDLDLNEVLTFSIDRNSLVPSDPSLGSIENTAFDVNEEDVIVITFQPLESMKGHFTFSAVVTDSVSSSSEATCIVYFINDIHVAEFRFDNSPDIFINETVKDQVRAIFSDIYELGCNIDKAGSTPDEDGNSLANKTTLETHFVNVETNEPVSASLIINLPYEDPGRYVNLTARLQEIGLNLEIPYSEEPEEAGSITTYLLMGAIAVLAAVLIILSVSCWFNSRRLSLRVRALTASTFGSQGELHRGGSMELPNTNQHAVQGSNPIWTTDGNKMHDFDAESVGSGGSVLIGVENDDDFRNYAGMGGEDEDFSFAFGGGKQGSFNPIFGATILEQKDAETNVPDLSLPGVGRRNPLMTQSLND